MRHIPSRFRARGDVVSKKQMADAIARHLDELQAHVDTLRRTARDLRFGELHPSHAANRLDKMADALGGSEPKHRHDYSDGDVCGGCDQVRAR